ncbi:AAA family ATPase [Streptomyces sp. WMMC500]|uniref:helix-turn-helix transcriptional regulator n=1 Tax=Streptomyces sp. WMMC500 TaxID=3015154 RepID=UPI00248BC0CD|nr:LuxR family transcriptional regulator [Streptomyces sp. WMMC500]WBB61219.1 AAA family ATPase [Streptomyces sp. WMMC500]
MATPRTALVLGGVFDGAGRRGVRTLFGHDGHGTELFGRASECARLDEVITAARLGESRVLVVEGEPGIGKSALLDYLESSASGMRTVRAAGVESEMELAFATLHQLCAPLMEGLEELPAPQRTAVESVFGVRDGTPPERFLVGLAVLSLLSAAAEKAPLLCVIDDAQWMDAASAQVLGFVARRLQAESVALVLGSRRSSQDLFGLPVMALGGLGAEDARALLSSVAHGPVDAEVRDRFVAETRGNPLALLELPRELAEAGIAGGLGLMDAETLPGKIEQSFLDRIERLPRQTRLFLLVAAAEPAGDPALVERAAERLGVTPATVVEDGTDGLLDVGERAIFRHPLVRSAVYRSAGKEERRAVHLALAEVTDARAAPDRRAWHLASAATAPDEAVAAELEQSADRARARGGLSAMAAFLQRSVELTADGSRRTERALAAAEAGLRAGDVDVARRFADLAARDAQDEWQSVRAHLVRGHVTFAAGFNDEAPPMLLAAAQRLESFDMDLARETYLIAWVSASYGAGDQDSLLAISRAMMRLPPPEGSPRALDLLVEGHALLVTEGRKAALPSLRSAADAIARTPPKETTKWIWAAGGSAALLWEDRLMVETHVQAAEEVRAAGAVSEFPVNFHAWGIPALMSGDFTTGSAIVAESEALAASTGVGSTQHTKLLLKALEGDEDEGPRLLTAAIERETANSRLNGIVSANWAAALLYNGLARYDQALRAARATARGANVVLAQWALPEVVEAATRVGDDTTAQGALDDLAAATESCDTDWAQGILARCRALVSRDDDADRAYREAIERLGRTILRPELARAHLLYGEWLRRNRRRAEARPHLRTAHETFVSIGMRAFAERSRRELLATGETVRKRAGTDSAVWQLTAQESQIAMHAAEGLTNPEIAARLFLSPRTVEFHLGKVFAKLGIGSRTQLEDALADSGHAHGRAC